MNQSIRLS